MWCPDSDNRDGIRPTYESVLTTPSKLISSFVRAKEFIMHINEQYHKHTFMNFDIDKKYGIDVDYLRNIIIDSIYFASRFCDSSIKLRKKINKCDTTLKINRSINTNISKLNSHYTININANMNPYDSLYDLCVDLFCLEIDIDETEIDELIVKMFDENSYSDGEYAYKNIICNFREDRSFYRLSTSYVNDFIKHLDYKNDINGVFKQLQDSALYKIFLDLFALGKFIHNMHHTPLMKGLECMYNNDQCVNQHQDISYKRIRKNVTFIYKSLFKDIVKQILHVCNKNNTLNYKRIKVIDYDDFLDTYQNYMHVNHYEYYGKFLTPQEISFGHGESHWGFFDRLKEWEKINSMSKSEQEKYFETKRTNEFLDAIFREV